jgi:hypothetical protein
MINIQEKLRAALDFLDIIMAQLLLRSRRIMVAGVLLLLVGVVALSTATRKPCLQVSTAAWHVWKSGYMTKSKRLEAYTLSIAADAHVTRTAPEEAVLPAPSIYTPHEETIPPAIPLIAQIRHFRAPPSLG